MKRFTGSLYRKDFVRQNGLDIQATDLAFWEKLLKPDIYKLVEAECFKQNATLETESGYEVFRGNSIDCFIKNIR